MITQILKQSRAGRSRSRGVKGGTVYLLILLIGLMGAMLMAAVLMALKG